MCAGLLYGHWSHCKPQTRADKVKVLKVMSRVALEQSLTTQWTQTKQSLIQANKTRLHRWRKRLSNLAKLQYFRGIVGSIEEQRNQQSGDSHVYIVIVYYV